MGIQNTSTTMIVASENANAQQQQQQQQRQEQEHLLSNKLWLLEIEQDGSSSDLDEEEISSVASSTVVSEEEEDANHTRNVSRNVSRLRKTPSTSSSCRASLKPQKKKNKRHVQFDLTLNQTQCVMVPDDLEKLERWYTARDYAMFQYNTHNAVTTLLEDHDVYAMWEFLMEACQKADAVAAEWLLNNDNDKNSSNKDDEREQEATAPPSCTARLRQQLAEHYRAFDTTGLEAWFHVSFPSCCWPSKQECAKTTVQNIRYVQDMTATAMVAQDSLLEWYRSSSQHQSQPCRLFAREIALSLHSSLLLPQ